MQSVKFFPLDIDYKNGVRILGRTTDSKNVCVIDNSLKPYFLVVPKKQDDPNIEKLKRKILTLREENNFVISTETIEKKLLGKRIKAIKVNVNNPAAVKIISDIAKEDKEIDSIRENDIPFHRRYLIDKQITPLTLCEVYGEPKKTNLDVDFLIEGEVKQDSPEIINPKILAFDIEVYDVANLERKGGGAILTIAFYGKDFKRVITWKKFKEASRDVEFVKDEAELINKFKDIVKIYKPDYLAGYFSDGFDFPYLESRAKKYNMELNIGLDKTKIKVAPRTGATKIKGIIHLDLFQFITKVMAGSLQFDSYSLGFVAQELLGDKKQEIEIRNVAKIWESGDIKNLCEYNLNDARLTFNLCEKILPNLTELVKLTGMLLFDVCRSSYGQLAENYLMSRANELNEIILNRPTGNEITIRRMYSYPGAFVMEPKPGLYNDIIIFDFMSLYPTIVVAKNICLSTLTKQEKNSYKTPEIEVDGAKKNYFFEYEKEGFIPVVIRDLITRRNRIKELIKEEENPVLEARSYALKTVANSLIGYLGFFGARWYSRECAASTLAFARNYIQDVIGKTKKEGFNVLYSDTDSVAFTLGNKNEEDAILFLKKINQELPSLIELELEGFYPRGIFVAKKFAKESEKGAKKKYALINQRGNIKIRGFETVRRDWSYLARETQRKILELVLKEGSIDKSIAYIKDVIEKLRKKETPNEKLIMQTQLKMSLDSYEQIGPHVAVAKKMQEKGIDVTSGTIIWYIIAEGKGMIRDRAKIPEECKEKEYDSEYYINNQIIPAVEKIFEVFGIKKEDLLAQEQSKLGQF